VSDHIAANFVPVRINLIQQPNGADRFGAVWTPTVLVVDAAGKEHYRLEGYLPASDLLEQLELGLGHAALGNKKWAEAQQHYDNVLRLSPHGFAAPEALYWAGVSRYRASGNPQALAETARQFETRFQDSIWAKKASVWGAPAKA
jgi:hypothetical protein